MDRFMCCECGDNEVEAEGDCCDECFYAEEDNDEDDDEEDKEELLALLDDARHDS